MGLKYVAVVCFIAQALATQVSFQQPESVKTQQNEQYWQPSDLDSSASSPGESFHPLTFESTKQVNQQQSDSDGQLLDPSAAETVIDEILVSNRQGRNLDGFDEVYADPEIKQVLELGNDTIARSYIRDKLCTLNLMKCDDVEERRPYYSPHRDIHPHDVIYAQPVTIKPVGRPLPAIPVKRPGGFLGSKPFVPGPVYPGSPPHGPGFNGPTFVGNSPPSFSGPYPGYKKPGLKPVYESGFEGGIDYDDKFINKKEGIIPVVGSGIQQHVHHHYHHSEGNGGASSPIIGPGPIGNNGFNNYGYGNGGGSFNNYEEYKKNFKVKGPSSGNNLVGQASNDNYANRYPLYEKPSHNDFNTFNGKGSSQSGKQLGSGFGSFGGLGNNNNFNQGFGSNNYKPNNEFDGFENGLGSNYDDCVCVPFDQCVASDHAGRKDDLYLAIDPRSLGKNIDAETEEVVVTDSNGTMSTVRVPKNVNNTESLQQKNSTLKEAPTTQTSEEKRTKRDVASVNKKEEKVEAQSRQFGRPPACGPHRVCCNRNHIKPGNNRPRQGQCGVRYSQGIAGRIKTPVYIDGDSEFGEYPWQVAILKKEPGEKESVYVCGGTLISPRHIITAAHCIKSHSGRDLRARLGEWDVNHDVEFFPYIERDIVSVVVHPEFYAGTLYNDIAVLKLDYDINFDKNPHISPACLPDKFDDFVNTRCWTTGWGKDAFDDFGKYQHILKEVDVPVISNGVCERQMRRTRLGPSFNLHPGFVCAGGEEGKDACKGDGGGPMVCERQGRWHLAGVVSWGIGCGQAGVPGVYARVSYYLDWIRQIMNH